MSDEPEIMPSHVKRLGDPRGKPGGWTLLPVNSDEVCSECGVPHFPEEPHNPQSLFYQYAFYAEHERWPTWSDALAHCDDDMKARWKQALIEHGVPEEQLEENADGETDAH